MILQIPADSLRAVLDSVFAQPAYQWNTRPNPLDLLARWWRELQVWLADLQDTNPVLFGWFFWGLVVLLVLIFAHAGWVTLRTIRAASASSDPARSYPEVGGQDAGWHRHHAQQLAAEGRYREAVQAEFLGLVLELDARRILRFHPSKTPNEYTREARLSAAERERLSALVGLLYGYIFARRRCGPAEYHRWRESASGAWHAPAQ